MDTVSVCTEKSSVESSMETDCGDGCYILNVYILNVLNTTEQYVLKWQILHYKYLTTIKNILKKHILGIPRQSSGQDSMLCFTAKGVGSTSGWGTRPMPHPALPKTGIYF